MTTALWRGLDELPASLERSVVTIGVYDGVHLGHRAILARARERADALGAPLVVVTFDPHPSEVVRPGTHPAMLTTLEHRARLLGEAGADAVLVLHFSVQLSRLTPAEFVQIVLVDRLRMVAVVVGANFRFGHRAVGTVETLADLGRELGFEVDGVELVGAGEVRWSSTYVRQCVAEGDTDEAARVLGRPHRVEGVVVHGDHRGRELGYPTANLLVTGPTSIPADGVYAGWLVRASGDSLPAAISVGTNPTFSGAERRVEAYCIDEVGLDLYGEAVAVDFGPRLRDMVRFDAVEPLVAQMREDVDRARAITAG
ncbi:MAG TPA: bifunctional riboflavin kinase/FAD synthetase [Actinomycetes bacterium]|nr:bifunctional riboflavin kinase/FAD synthetase [Actinomycetes bacterium]